MKLRRGLAVGINDVRWLLRFPPTVRNDLQFGRSLALAHVQQATTAKRTFTQVGLLNTASVVFPGIPANACLYIHVQRWLKKGE